MACVSVSSCWVHLSLGSIKVSQELGRLGRSNSICESTIAGVCCLNCSSALCKCTVQRRAEQKGSATNLTEHPDAGWGVLSIESCML